MAIELDGPQHLADAGGLPSRPAEGRLVAGERLLRAAVPGRGPGQASRRGARRHPADAVAAAEGRPSQGAVKEAGGEIVIGWHVPELAKGVVDQARRPRSLASLGVNVAAGPER